MGKIESMTVISSGFSIIENCLVRDFKLKHLSKYKSCCSGTDSIRNVKTQYKPQHMLGVMNFKEIDGCSSFCGLRMLDIFISEMIFSIDVIDGEVSGDHLLEHPFRRIQLFEILFLAVTFLIAAFIDCYFLFLFPLVKSIATIGAIIF